MAAFVCMLNLFDDAAVEGVKWISKFIGSECANTQKSIYINNVIPSIMNVGVYFFAQHRRSGSALPQ